MVIGVDISAEQIGAAESTENVSFRNGSAEELNFLENGCVDLVTAAQAIYWFNRDRFFSEVIRVLKPSGLLTVYGYGLPTLDNVRACPLVTEFYYDLMGDYCDKGTAEAISMQRGLPIPLAEVTRLTITSAGLIEKEMDIDAFVGYLSTPSAWRAYLKDQPESDFLERLKIRLEELYKSGPDHQTSTITVTWPVFLIVGRNTS